MKRRAKIVCTLGPATASYEGILALVYAGMDVARLNFSHGSYEDHRQAYDWVRQASDESGRGVGILMDLQGPKIRLGRFGAGPTVWATGESVTITTEPCPGDHDRVSTTYLGMAEDVVVGDRVLIDDGRVALRVTGIDGPNVRLLVTEGGPVSNNKGISLPGANVSVPALTEKDAADLRFGLAMRVDLVALSFVRTADDAKGCRAIMSEVGIKVPLLAKIEKPQAVDNLEAIVAAFDGIMVARGDLGVEIPLERVPLVQKRCVQMARDAAKPVIVATQMLDSMISASRPTRAEASDVANAVLDGADAVMLSGETSVGAFPVESVATMARIVVAAEEDLARVPQVSDKSSSIGGAIAKAAPEVAAAVGARALVAFTQSGDTVRRLAEHRSPIPLLAFTPVPEVRNQLSLVWGVETFLFPAVTHTDEMVQQVEKAMLDLGRMDKGDLLTIVAGSPPSTSGSTNAMRVHTIGGFLQRPPGTPKA
ncbi:MAG: pyk [Frankiales bacterium]|nr:pyk [Frankiales bacterium]